MVLKDNDSSKKKNIVLKQSATKATKGSEITITVNEYSGGEEETPSKPKPTTNTSADTTSNETKEPKATNTVNKEEQT